MKGAVEPTGLRAGRRRTAAERVRATPTGESDGASWDVTMAIVTSPARRRLRASGRTVRLVSSSNQGVINDRRPTVGSPLSEAFTLPPSLGRNSNKAYKP